MGRNISLLCLVMHDKIADSYRCVCVCDNDIVALIKNKLVTENTILLVTTLLPTSSVFQRFRPLFIYFCWLLVEPLAGAHGTLGYHRTPAESHWCTMFTSQPNIPPDVMMTSSLFVKQCLSSYKNRNWLVQQIKFIILSTLWDTFVSMQKVHP